MEMRAIKSDEFANTFPTLDIKLHNSGTRPLILTTVRLLVESLVVDDAPSLEYDLTCDDAGGLGVTIRNFGWGDAKLLDLKFDLREFCASIAKAFQQINIDKIDQAELIPDGRHKRFRSTFIKLLESKEVNPSGLPKQWHLQRWLSSEQKPGRNYERDRQIAAGGIESVPLLGGYSSRSGEQFRDDVKVGPIQRGAYDWKRIYYDDSGFRIVPYDGGVRYSLISPSCSYHILLDPEKVDAQIDISTAHKVVPGGIERFLVVVGARKSSILRGALQLVGPDGVIDSQKIDIGIWNPRNSFISLAEGNKLDGQSIFIKRREGWLGSRESPIAYDVAERKKERTHSWGY